jgi:hypothetical protein
MTTNSLQIKNSRYVQGGLTEVGEFGLEWWDRYDIPSHPSDRQYIVEDKYKNRPDLIANAFYGDWSLWWLICQYNYILDPHAELVAGLVLIIPTLERIQLLFNRKIGGTISTRTLDTLISPIIL